VNILVIEDDRRLADLIARRLRTAGHTVETCDDGSRGLDRATAGGLDLAIVDVMLPGMDGISLTRTLRDRDVAIPILMLTARDGIDDRVDGLRSGADDYLIKPFAFDELLARVDALARRSRGAPAGAILRHGAVTLDPRSRRVHVEGEEVELTSKEFDLLTCLLEHRGQVLTRAELKELVWDFPFDAQTKVVAPPPPPPRRKLGPGGDIIRTVRGVGYSVGR